MSLPLSDPEVVVPVDGTVTRWVVVCSTVVVVAGSVVVSVRVVCSVVVVSAAWPPVAIAPASSAPAAKRTARPENPSAFSTVT